MTKQELEIKCNVLEERLQKINDICEAYTFKSSKAAETIGSISYYCDPTETKRSIDFKIHMSK